MAASTPLLRSTIAWAVAPSLPMRWRAGSTTFASRASGRRRVMSTTSSIKNGIVKVLQPYVEKRMREFYRANWQQNLSVAAGGDRTKPLDAYALLRTMIDNWQVFSNGL